MADASPFKVFINYRHDDSPGDARLLYDRLAQHFGADNVFFDAHLDLGVDWLAEIRRKGLDGGAFLAVMGPRWTSTLKDRREAGVTEDFVRREIEWALRDWPGKVIPVLIGASMPEEKSLPRSIRGLARRQAARIDHGASLDRDVGDLIERLEHIARQGTDPKEPAPGEPPTLAAKPQPSRPSGPAPSGVPAPYPSHYAEVIEAMLDGTVVPLLGSSVRGSLPGAVELAERLATRFEVSTASNDLAEIAQYIAVTRGENTLYRAMREFFATEAEPTEVHRFLADLPGLLRRRGLDPQYQLIISTSYDRALERAFEEKNEPFDYALYHTGDGWFVHFPWGEGDAEPRAETIKEPKSYLGFPIDELRELERTVIVKIYGSTDGQEADFKWVNNYVITEDHYIDYLPTDKANNLVPCQILDKLTGSRCLFLGYPMRDWNARVFISRIWRREMTDNSWAIEESPDVLEKDSWKLIPRVELLAAPLADYVAELRACLLERTSLSQPAV